jgi:hypothetical protein
MTLILVHTIITGHTFRGYAYVTKNRKVFSVRANNGGEGVSHFGSYPDRLKASVAATLVDEMKEKGETVDAIKARVYIEHGNKKKTP